MIAGVLLVAWHLLYFTGIDGNVIAINPSSVVAVRVSPVGYRPGTMITTGSGSYIVRESVSTVNKQIECECQGRETK